MKQVQFLFHKTITLSFFDENTTNTFTQIKVKPWGPTTMDGAVLPH